MNFYMNLYLILCGIELVTSWIHSKLASRFMLHSKSIFVWKFINNWFLKIFNQQIFKKKLQKNSSIISFRPTLTSTTYQDTKWIFLTKIKQIMKVVEKHHIQGIIRMLRLKGCCLLYEHANSFGKWKFFRLVFASM